jgi:hypothetical protein
MSDYVANLSTYHWVREQWIKLLLDYLSRRCVGSLANAWVSVLLISGNQPDMRSQLYEQKAYCLNLGPHGQ